MTIRIQADHKVSGPVGHRWFPDGKFGTLNLGAQGLGNSLFFDSAVDIDEVIAELVALRAEMTAPVITCSERDCPEVNPDGSGEHCHKGGIHKTHRDSNGDTWTAPEPKCLDAYDRPGRTDYCQRDKGHGGQHVGHMGTRWSQAHASVTA